MKLHRLREIRRRKKLSQRVVAGRMGVSVAIVELQERETCDIPLSTLHRWHRALGVPLAELLREQPTGLSPLKVNGGQMVRLMQTALTIFDEARHARDKRLAQALVGQLLDIVPELRKVKRWKRSRRPHASLKHSGSTDMALPENVFRLD